MSKQINYGPGKFKVETLMKDDMIKVVIHLDDKGATLSMVMRPDQVQHWADHLENAVRTWEAKRMGFR
jgi:hypothetical protein